MIEINTPWVQTATLNPPTLQDNTADADRLISALKANIQSDAIDVDLALLKKLPALLRKWEYRVRCIVFKDRHRWLLTGITDAADATPIAGLAIDLGTTRVVLRLIDLITGRTLVESAFDNPDGMAKIPELWQSQVEGEEYTGPKEEKDEPLMSAQVIIQKQEQFIDFLHASKNSNI